MSLSTNGSTGDGPVTIRFTDEERVSGTPSASNLFKAINGFFTDGLVVLDNVIDPVLLDRLNERMMEDVQSVLGRENTHFK